MTRAQGTTLRRPVRRLLCLALALGLLGAARPAGATPEVRAFVAAMGNTAVQMLSEGIADPVERRTVVHRLLSESFDLPLLGRLSLGRFWRVASDEQRSEFQQLFAAFLTNLYSNSLERSPQDPPVVTGFGIDRVRAEPEQEYLVLSHFDRPAGHPFRVEWRIRGDVAAYRIIDVSVEGISMIVLFRQMLATAVHEGGGDVDGLLVRLRDMVGGAPAVAPVNALP